MSILPVKLTIEYDGTDFQGWQIQAGGRTVQGVIQSALTLIYQQLVNVTGAGRTDAGVHAFGQVAHSLLPEKRDLSVLQKSLNAIVKPDIVIRSIQETSESFHARFDAVRRTYEYRITKTPVAVHRRYCWHISADLALPQMESAARVLRGEHDFRAYCSEERCYEKTRCLVYDAHWHEEGERLIFTISASRFLRKMVRTIVGTMIDIGRGKIDSDELGAILESKDRARAGQTAPAHGLFLMEVNYPQGLETGVLKMEMADQLT